MGLISWIKKQGSILVMAGSVVAAAGLMKAGQEMAVRQEAQIAQYQQTTALSKKHSSDVLRLGRILTNTTNILTTSYDMIEDANELEKLGETKGAFKMYNDVLRELKDVLEMVEDPSIIAKVRKDLKTIEERLKKDHPAEIDKMEQMITDVDNNIIHIGELRERLVEELKILIQKVEKKVHAQAI